MMLLLNPTDRCLRSLSLDKSHEDILGVCKLVLVEGMMLDRCPEAAKRQKEQTRTWDSSYSHRLPVVLSTESPRPL